MPYIVVTEHWPHNPSKPVWWHVETRPLKSAVDASFWVESSAKFRKKNYPSKCTGKTFVVKVMDDDDLKAEIAKEIEWNRGKLTFPKSETADNPAP
jgi:hypothetical protein